MSGKRIIYINHRMLADDRIRPMLDQYDYDWNSLLSRNQFDPGLTSWYCRQGTNTLPFHTDIIDVIPKLAMPILDPKFNMNFSDVTDLRCQELISKYENRPWAVLWSGGIDSTLLVASLLKNTSPADRSQITIFCNNSSIYENPRFFHNQILPNFSIADSATNLTELLSKGWLILHGEPGDQIFGHRGSRLFYNNDYGECSWLHEPDVLLWALARLQGRQFAEWLYETMKQNILSVDVEIQTIRDWFWWLSFNYCWIAVKLRPQIHFGENHSMQDFLQNCIGWFESLEYQQWAMNNNAYGAKNTNNPGDCKKVAKDYINEIYNDSYYYRFKTKVDSDGRITTARNPWICMLDDLSLVKIDDFDSIADVFVDHVNAKSH